MLIVDTYCPDEDHAVQPGRDIGNIISILFLLRADSQRTLLITYIDSFIDSIEYEYVVGGSSTHTLADYSSQNRIMGHNVYTQYLQHFE